MVKQIRLAQLRLEVGATSQDQTSDVALVIGDEMLCRQLGDLTNVVVARLFTQTRETQGRLTTTACERIVVVQRCDSGWANELRR